MGRNKPTGRTGVNAHPEFVDSGQRITPRTITRNSPHGATTTPRGPTTAHKQRGCAMAETQNNANTSVVESEDADARNARELQLEQQQSRRFRELARQMAQECGPMWRYGDGNGGFILKILRDEFEAQGYGSSPLPVSKPRRKSIGTKLALKVFANDDYTCQHCGTRDNLTVDHIIPVIQGGTNEISNLQTLCQSCNSSKGGR